MALSFSFFILFHLFAIYTVLIAKLWVQYQFPVLSCSQPDPLLSKTLLHESSSPSLFPLQRPGLLTTTGLLYLDQFDTLVLPLLQQLLYQDHLSHVRYLLSIQHHHLLSFSFSCFLELPVDYLRSLSSARSGWTLDSSWQDIGPFSSSMSTELVGVVQHGVCARRCVPSPSVTSRSAPAWSNRETISANWAVLVAASLSSCSSFGVLQRPGLSQRLLTRKVLSMALLPDLQLPQL